MNAHIRKEGRGYIIDVKGEESPGQKFFVGKITFEEDRCKCPLCFSTALPQCCPKCGGKLPKVT